MVISTTAGGILMLPANQPLNRFYRGGAKIDRFRGAPRGADHRPEDWIASTTALAGETTLGLTRLADGRVLRDLIAADPVAWLGAQHVERYGATTMLLVKLLDAGQRLPVHAHPHDDWSRSHLGRRCGKAEAWYILEGGDVHLGLRESVSDERLLDLVQGQRTEDLLALLHRRSVRPGDVVYVPPGELHAIGGGVFLLELQQPEDLSILLEWKGFELDGPRDGHLGVGFEHALTAVNRTARRSEEIDAFVVRGADGPSILPPAADPYFRLERWSGRVEGELAAGFAVLLVERGAFTLETRAGAHPLVAGATALTSSDTGPIGATGEGTLLVCRPPSASLVPAPA